MFLDIPRKVLEPITKLHYAKVVQVILGYNNWDGIVLKAFGVLITERENRKILGILFLSSLFKHRAPRGGALLSIFVGGTKKPELTELPDEQIRKLVLNEVNELLRVSSTPDLLKIIRYEHAIPQYYASSKERYETIAYLQEKFPGLILAGNIRDGIGMGDRIAQGRKIADSIIENLKSQ